MARSFFSKLTGGSDDEYDFTVAEKTEHDPQERHMHVSSNHPNDWAKEEPGGELAVDVFQNADNIVVKALIAGVPPGSIDISLTREMLTISGKREEEKEVEDDNYFRRELYWGAFSRTILLPEEVDVDLAEASEKHGILSIRLPKINKKKEMRLKVKAR